MTDTAALTTQVIAIVLAVACFGSFTWSIQRFFVRQGAIAPGMRLVQAFGLVFMLVHLTALSIWFHRTWPTATPAIGLYAASLCLFWWAIRTLRARRLTIAFSRDPPQHLVTGGPYRWIRHPLYTSYAIAWSAGILATLAWWLVPSFLIMGAIYWCAARQEERKFALSDLSVAYECYSGRTGMFLPRLRTLFVESTG